MVGGTLSLLVATVLLTFTLLLLAPAGPAAAHPSSFPDVSPDLSVCPAHDAIEFMTGAGVVSGYKDGTFGPGKTLTRGQATKVLVLWREVPLVTPSKLSFLDLDSVYRTYVETAAAQGWITGYEDNRFRPYSTLSRQQMAIIMVRAMGWDAEAAKLSSSRIKQILSPFSDVADIAAVARPYVALAVERGLFSGSGGRLMPRDGITRAQFSLVVFRAELSMRAVVQQVRFAADYPDKTRVVVDLSRAADTVSAAISADGTLTVDYTGGAVSSPLTQPVGSLEVASVDAKQQAYAPRTVRLTLKLARYQTFRVLTLAPSDGAGHRIVVDVFRRVEGNGPDGAGPPLICVDAGHGGTDPGATGVSGAKEKDINLAMALLLAEDLEQAGLKVMMTRTTDTYPALQERADMANAAKASLFVSIHNNAHANCDVCGTETFYAGTNTSYSTEGKLLAEAIQRKLVEALETNDRGAKTHWNRLVVLSQTSMTAVLTEVGFMTNAAEEAALLSSAYQETAAQAIADGILEYLKWSTKVSIGW